MDKNNNWKDQSNTSGLMNESMRSQLKEEIKSKLMAKGYEYKEGRDADLMVTFRIIEGETEIPVTDKNEDENDGIVDISQTETVEKGTLLVQLVDVKDGKVVWQNYASGALNEEEIQGDKKEKIAQAVEEVFEFLSASSNE